MSENSKIEWTDHTFNPWWGCSRVSPGCRFCYADRDAKRRGHGSLWRRKGERRMLSDNHWAQPLKWNRAAEKAAVPAKVFCASMADVFEDHPQLGEPRKRLWDLIEATPWLTWQLLTKRPENVAGMAPWGESWPANVWLGTSVEDQRRADERIPVLRQVKAAVLYLSCEPLLGPVDLFGDVEKPGPACSVEGYSYRTNYGTGTEHAVDVQPGIDWVICGGESGPRARPMHPGWARSLRDQCVAAGVPFLFKQWGEWAPPTPTGYQTEHGPVHYFDDRTVVDRVGKKRAGRDLDGRTWDEYPELVPA